ncbi:MAG: hypothetical protein KJ601_01820, partial [Nanoarchaeota archaeon]|nr:hypothetical protein [Nanoarchaeota archaeon]
YRSLQEKEEKTKAKENLLDMMGISGADRKKKICYVSFGAGSGAEQVYGSILEAAGRLDDYIFVISNAGVDRLLDEQGYSVSSTKRNNVKSVEAANGTKVYLTSQEQIDHMKTVALADIMIQGNGSATTYESIAAQTPMVCIPLNRPGYEQLIKGVGVELSGSGKVLFLDEVQDQLKSFRDLTHQDGNLPAKKYTTDSLVDAIGAVQKDYGNYKDALCGMQTYFADPYVTAQVLKDMSLGHEVQRIIRNNGLKSFR